MKDVCSLKIRIVISKNATTWEPGGSSPQILSSVKVPAGQTVNVTGVTTDKKSDKMWISFIEQIDYCK